MAKASCAKRATIPALYSESEKDNSREPWRALFLARLAETSNVTLAADCAGVSTSHVYKMRRERADFAREWYAALREGYEHLELETLRRLREGVPVDGPKFDIANALRLLTLHRETVARERAKTENCDEASVLASLNRKLEAMRQNELAFEAIMAEENQGRAGGSEADK